MPLTRPRFEQLNTIVTNFTDPISVLNKGSTLANIDVGFIFNRDGGLSSNVAVFWDESANTFVTSFTTDSGSNNANITITEYANLRVNHLTGTIATASQTNITSVGNLTALALSGNVNTTGYYFGNGSQLTGIITSVTKIINGTSNVSAFDSSNVTVSVGGVANTVIFSSSTPASSTTTGAVRIAGGLGATGNIFAGGNISAGYFSGSGAALTGINSFGNVFIDGQSPVLADNTSDTLTLVAGSGITITTDAANDSITFTTVSVLGAFAADADFGLVTDVVVVSEDLGDLDSTSSTTYDLGSLLSAEGLVFPSQLVLPSYDNASLPSATVPAQLIYNTTTQSLAYTDGVTFNNIVGGYSNVQVTAYLSTHSGAIQSSNVQTTTANIQTSTDATDTATGALRVMGGAGVAGTVFAGNFNTAGNVLASNAVFSSVNVNGNITVTTAYIIPSANASSSLGTSATRWNYVYGVNGNFQSVNANYADLAERFESDMSMLPGTVVMLGGIKEITAVVKELCEDVFGVISTKAAFLMNGQAGPDNTHPPVAVNGRVPVRVVGQVKKGDRLVSAGGGLARSAMRSEITPFNVIGRALEDKLTFNEGVVEAIVKLNF